MKHYPESFDQEESHGHACRLLEEAGVEGGVVLDLGCGFSPLAESVAALGHTWVGADIEADAVEALQERGFEAHQLDLAEASEVLDQAIDEIVGDRRVVAVLLLDVLEHLVEPGAVLRSIGRLAEAHSGIQVIVSIPNVTHFDVASKLLLGRWDLTETGLLDDTHLRFFNEGLVLETLAAAGWVEVGTADVSRRYSDQLFPADAPALRPGAPLRELLMRVRSAADPHAETYQFVRRFEFDPARAEETRSTFSARRPDSDDFFLSVAVRGVPKDGSLEQLLQELVRQGVGDAEVLIDVAEGQDPAVEAPEGVSLRTVQSATVGAWINQVGAEARGRYLTFLDAQSRVEAGYLAAIRAAVDYAPGRVVQVGVQTDGVASQPEPVELDGFEAVSGEPFGKVALDSFVLPRQVFASGLQADDDAGELALVGVVARATEFCGIVRSAGPVLTVDPATLHRLNEDSGFLMETLKATPMIIPAGAGPQLIELRHRLLAAQRERDALEDELEDAHGRIGVLAANLRQRDEALAERDSSTPRQ